MFQSISPNSLAAGNSLPLLPESAVLCCAVLKHTRASHCHALSPSHCRKQGCLAAAAVTALLSWL
jgi:hypothetical protein